MSRVWCASFVGVLALAAAAQPTRAQNAAPTLLAQARDAEAAYQFDLALETHLQGRADRLTGKPVERERAEDDERWGGWRPPAERG